MYICIQRETLVKISGVSAITYALSLDAHFHSYWLRAKYSWRDYNLAILISTSCTGKRLNAISAISGLLYPTKPLLLGQRLSISATAS